MLDLTQFDESSSSQASNQAATDDHALLDAYSNAVIGVTDRRVQRGQLFASCPQPITVDLDEPHEVAGRHRHGR